jgi:hypothetical protein
VPVGITTLVNFDGVDDTAQASQSGFLVVPPDTNGTVGATQFVQWVNLAFAVFDKRTGAKVFGPAAGNTFWGGFGGPCETNNSGDPVIQYDKAAGRWVAAQPVFVAPFMYCLAVSTTSRRDRQVQPLRLHVSRWRLPGLSQVGHLAGRLLRYV